MADELAGMIFGVNQQVEKPQVIIPEAQGPIEPAAPAALEQVQVVDAAFVQDDESPALAQLVGLWGGTMLLADQAKEHLQPPEDEEPRLPNLDEDPPGEDD